MEEKNYLLFTLYIYYTLYSVLFASPFYAFFEKSVRKEEKKVTNSDLKAHVKEMIEKMCANHKEMCDKHDIMMTKLEEISNSAKSFAAELVDLKQAGVVGSGEKDQAQKLEELSIASARISSEIRTILKSGSATK